MSHAPLVDIIVTPRKRPTNEPLPQATTPSVAGTGVRAAAGQEDVRGAPTPPAMKLMSPGARRRLQASLALPTSPSPVRSRVVCVVLVVVVVVVVIVVMVVVVVVVVIVVMVVVVLLVVVMVVMVLLVMVMVLFGVVDKLMMMRLLFACVFSLLHVLFV